MPGAAVPVRRECGSMLLRSAAGSGWWQASPVRSLLAPARRCARLQWHPGMAARSPRPADSQRFLREEILIDRVENNVERLFDPIHVDPHSRGNARAVIRHRHMMASRRNWSLRLDADRIV